MDFRNQDVSLNASPARKNEQDVHLLERLAFIAKREGH
jgi:hypothetical protein